MIPYDVTLPHLNTFAKAAELSSFTAAGKALGLTQAAVSQRIQDLEKILNKSLFHRQQGRVKLTETGFTLYDYAQRILELHREARIAVSGEEIPIESDLLLAASSVPGEHLLPGFLALFGTKFPHIRVRAILGDSIGVIRQVERGEVSFGLVGRKVDNPHLEYRFLAQDQIRLIVPKGHPLYRKKKITLDQLTEYPLVLREPDSGLRHCFERSIEKAHRSLSDFRIVLEMGSNEAVKEAIFRGLGLGILSTLAVEKEVQSDQLFSISIQGLDCEREMFIVRDRRRVLPLSARLFLSSIEEQTISHLSS